MTAQGDNGKDDQPRCLRSSYDANPKRLQKMMWYQHDAMTEMHVEEVQRLLERAEYAEPERAPEIRTV